MSYDRLKGVIQFGRSQISDTIEQNLVSFFDWGTINIGGYVNVQIPSTGLYAGQEHQLRLVKDPNYTSGRVWQAFRKNWVWETGVSWTPAPIQVSGVYVNGAFQPATGVGQYAHKIDYINGRVIFNSAISTSATVTAAYSYKIVKYMPVNENFMRDVQYNSFASQESGFYTASGNWLQVPENRLQLPAVGIQAVDRRTFDGMQLGGGQYMNNDVVFYIISENNAMKKLLVDIVSLQKDKTIRMYSINNMIAEGKNPLNYDGTINSSGIRSYTAMVAESGDGGYYFKNLLFSNTNVQSPPPFSPNIQYQIVRHTVQVPMPEI